MLLLNALNRFMPDRDMRYDFALKMCSALAPVADRRVKETLFMVLRRT